MNAFRNLVHMYIRCDTEHRHIPVQCINISFYNIARPLFSHARFLSQHLDRLQNRNTFVDFGFLMSKIQRIAHSIFIRIHEYLALLLQIGDKLIQRCFQLQTVKNDIYAICLDDIPECFLCILEGQLILFLLLQLGAAERTTYNDICTGIGFPFTSAMFTLHLFSPPSVEFQKRFSDPSFKFPSKIFNENGNGSFRGRNRSCGNIPAIIPPSAPFWYTKTVQELPYNTILNFK